MADLIYLPWRRVELRTKEALLFPIPVRFHPCLLLQCFPFPTCSYAARQQSWPLLLSLVFSFMPSPTIPSDSVVHPPLSLSSSSHFNNSYALISVKEPQKLEKILKNAATKDNTVIITTLNEAWAAPNSLLDLFLESFRLGNGTEKLLNHLVIIVMDQKAYERCLAVHKYCFLLVTDGIDFHQEACFMTPIYLAMMWRRTEFLQYVLNMGYNFIFTDTDVMWFRDPFPQFYSDADFQIACDEYTGNPDDLNNRPNGGYLYVKSNNRSREFYKFWTASRETYPGTNEQYVFNIIKFDPDVSKIGFKVRFLDTAYFGGFCTPSRDLNLVCIMHANCCFGLGNKLYDLRLMLQDWRAFISLPQDLKHEWIISWRVPKKCKD